MMMDTKTTAEQIADRYDNHGTCFEDAEGVNIGEVCAQEGSVDGADEVGNPIRYGFPDGSAIVFGGAAWDLAIPGSGHECRCWAGADNGRHREGCKEAGPHD